MIMLNAIFTTLCSYSSVSQDIVSDYCHFIYARKLSGRSKVSCGYYHMRSSIFQLSAVELTCIFVKLSLNLTLMFVDIYKCP